jgi:hypothetical protein
MMFTYLRFEISVRDVEAVQRLHAIHDLVEELAGLRFSEATMRNNVIKHLTPKVEVSKVRYLSRGHVQTCGRDQNVMYPSAVRVAGLTTST